MVLSWKKYLLHVGKEILSQVKEFKYLGILFMSEGKREQEMDRQIGAVCSHADFASVHRGEEGAEPKGEPLALPFDICSFPHLRLQALGRDRKNEIAGISV